MIESITYHLDWIFEVKRRLGKKYDPKLIEKVIYALVFLEQLKLNGLDFTFKGGTALLLATKEPKRFSIDIDIITEQTQSEIESVLEKISKKSIFTHWEDNNNRKHTVDAPVGHFKMFYTSNVEGSIEPILLDVLYTPNPYPEVMEIPIEHDWIQTTGIITKVKMPTFNAILGDKLTAFAPKTTGILYSKNRPVEMIKQLFDIAFLMDGISNLNVVKSSYAKVVAEEIKFRKLEVSATQVLHDTQEACYTLSTRDRKSDEFIHLQQGVSNFTNFTIAKFNIEQAITAAAKVAYLAEALKNPKISHIERFNKPLDVKDWLIKDQQYNKLNKLKKSNPEAFFYWCKASLSFLQNGISFSNNVTINNKGQIKSNKRRKRKVVKKGSFSSQDIKTLKEALYWSSVREVHFLDEVIVSSIKQKIDNEDSRVKIFNRIELSLILKTLNENINYTSTYKYPYLSEEKATSLRQGNLEPLFELRNKIMTENNKN